MIALLASVKRPLLTLLVALVCVAAGCACGACKDAPPPQPGAPGAPTDGQFTSSKLDNPFGDGSESGPPSAPKAIAPDAQRNMQVLGALTKDQIADVVKAQSAHVTNCANVSTPAAKGIVVVRLLIGGDGRVRRAKAVESSMGRSDVEDCLVGALKTWAFPPPKGGGIVSVTYPFCLE